MTVNASGTSTSGLTFSQNNLTLTAGGSQIVTITGGSGTYNVSNNANSSVASPGMSSNSITVYGSGAGSDTITVCDTANTCGTLSVTVSASGASSGNQAVTYGTPNPTLAAGQTLNVTLSGGATGYVVLSNMNSNVALATVTGTTLTLTGEGAGTDTVSVCATGGDATRLRLR